MSSKFVSDMSDVENKSEEYQSTIRFIDNNGKKITFEGSGNSLEELCSNLILNGITKVLDSEDSEKDVNLDDLSYHEDDVDTDDLLLNYAISLEEENEQLRDEVKFLREKLEQADKIIEKVPSVIKMTNEFVDAYKELQSENDGLYVYIDFLESDIKKLEESIDQKEDQKKIITELRASIANLQELVSQISFIEKNKEFTNPGHFTVSPKPITPNDWPQKYKVWM